MPERDYSKGQIYTIRCRDDPTLIYVGSTINTLPKRWCLHKTQSKIHTERLVYKIIAGNWERFYMELYELYPCGSKNELERREGEITREIGTMNNNIAGRTDKEYRQDNIEKFLQYYQDNKEDLIKYQIQYRQENKEVLLEQKRQYYQENTEKLKEYQVQYRQVNKEKISEKKRQYHLNNFEIINEKRRQRRALKKQEQSQPISTA